MAVIRLAGFSRCWNRAELLHQAQGVKLVPTLDDLALFDAPDANARQGHLLARGWNALERSLVGPAISPTVRDCPRRQSGRRSCSARPGTRFGTRRSSGGGPRGPAAGPRL